MLWNSHRRAGVDKPIVVSLYITKDSTYEFSVEDFGIGLRWLMMLRTLSVNMVRALKENSATELGTGMGQQN
jgi:hypothetical protein